MALPGSVTSIRPLFNRNALISGCQLWKSVLPSTARCSRSAVENCCSAGGSKVSESPCALNWRICCSAWAERPRTWAGWLVARLEKLGYQVSLEQAGYNSFCAGGRSTR
jgi:hypothetical protein